MNTSFSLLIGRSGSERVQTRPTEEQPAGTTTPRARENGDWGRFPLGFGFRIVAAPLKKSYAWKRAK